MPRQTKMQKMKGLWNASLALGCVLLVGLGIYGLGTINPVTSAQSNDSRLTVQGIDNIVQYLKEMEIYDPHDPTKKVVIGWDDTFGGVVIKGDVNMESIVVRAPGDANTAPNSNEAESSTVIGGTANRVEVSTDADTNKNLAIVAGAENSISNAGNAFVAGGSSVRVQNASNAAVVAASDSSIAGDQPKGQVAIIAGNKNTIDGAAINNTVIFAGEGNSTSASNTVLIGKNIHARNNQNIFAWSDGDQSFNPTHPNAFYVNATHGNLGVNTANPQVKADINGPLGIKTYELAALPSINPAWRGTMVTVSKHGKTGLCGWDGAKWVPLSLSAKQFAVCVQDVNMPPLPANTISNGKTKLPPLWNPAGNGAWETPQWTYHQRLGDGEYRCNKGYHIGNADPDGKVVAKNCVACTPIANQHEWTSDGKNNDCAFNCKASFKHNASARTCTACADGTYTTAGNTDSTCKNCTGLPANAHWTSNGTSETSCSWACNLGYNKRGNECKKATWTKVESANICNTSPGRWKDAYKSITYVCRDADGDVQDGNICNHRGTKPADITVNVEGDDNCNPPRLTEWSCNPPVCTGAGQCGGAKQNVNCTRSYSDPAGNTYPTSENLTKTEERSCNDPCQQAACGAAHNVNHASLSATSAGLCAVGTVDAFAEHSTNYTKKWTWKCLAKDGNTDCYAHKPSPEAGQCSSEIGKCLKGSSVMGSLANGSRWTCEGNHGGADVICNACNDGFRYDGSTNSCVSKCTGDYQYIPGATLHNGYCAKWKCESTSSTSAGSCSGSYATEGRCNYPSSKTEDERIQMGIDVSYACQRYHGNEARCKSIVEANFLSDFLPSGWGGFEMPNKLGVFDSSTQSVQLLNSYVLEYDNNDSPGIYHWIKRFGDHGEELPIGQRKKYLFSLQPFCDYIYGSSSSCAGPTTESTCKAQSSSCTRTPGSSSTTHRLKCVKADGSETTGCKDSWTKPQCPPATSTPSNPTPTPTACTPGKEETKGPNSIGDPCTVGKRTCLGNGTWSNWEYPTAPFADASCVNGALLYCGTGGQPSENGDHCECINNSGKIYLGIKWSGQNVNYHDLLMQQASQLLLVPNATWSDICGVTP